MMKVLKRLLENPIHIVVIGRTRSGKSYTTAKLVEMVLEDGGNVIVLDWAGEYSSPFLLKLKPIFSFTELKNDLPEILSEMIRVQSSTAGTWTYDAISRVIYESSSFNDLLTKLKELEDFPYRDVGARAARIRLQMLEKYFVEREIELTSAIIDFSELSITARKMAMTFYLVQLCNMVLKKGFRDFTIVIEEALNIPESLLNQLLTQFAGYKVKCIITSQSYNENFKQYNMIIHDLGLAQNDVLKYGLPYGIRDLKVGEAFVYDVERHKWKKIKVKPPLLVSLYPKFYREKEEEPIEDNVKTIHDVDNELPINNESNGERSYVNPQTITSISHEMDYQLIDRVFEEHKVLAKEINEIKAKLKVINEAIHGVESKVNKINEKSENENLKKLEIKLLSLNSNIEEIASRINGLQKYVAESIANLNKEFQNLKSELESRINQIGNNIVNKQTVKINQAEISNDDTVESLISKGILDEVYENKYLILIPRSYLGDDWRRVVDIVRREGFVVARRNGKMIFVRELKPGEV